MDPEVDLDLLAGYEIGTSEYIRGLQLIGRVFFSQVRGGSEVYGEC